MPQVRAAAQLQFGPQQQQLRQQGQNIAPFFQQYLQQLEASRVAQAGVFNNAVAQSQGMAQAQGVGAPTGQPPTQNSELASAVRQGMQEAFSSLLSTQGASYNALKEDQKVVGAASRLTAQTQNAKDKQALKAQKGAFKVDYAEQLRQTGHRERLENAAFNLDAAETQADVKTDRQQIRQDRRENRQEQRRENREPNKYGIPAGDWRKMSTGERQAVIKADKNSGDSSPAEKKSVFTPKEKAANRVKLRQMVSRVRAKDNGVSTYGQDTYRAMVDAGVDPVLARVAVAKALGKPMPAWAAKRLKRDYGITVSASGKVVRPKPTTNSNGVGNTGNTPGPNGEKRPN
jgi:hypothetical protein